MGIYTGISTEVIRKLRHSLTLWESAELLIQTPVPGRDAFTLYTYLLIPVAVMFMIAVLVDRKAHPVKALIHILVPDNNVEILCMCSLPISVFFLEMCLLQSFASFLIGLFSFDCWVDCNNCLYVLETLPLSHTWLYISKVRIVFHFLDNVLWSRTVLDFDKSCLRLLYFFFLLFLVLIGS